MHVKTLLIVAHIPSENTQKLANVAFDSVCSLNLENIKVLFKKPIETTVNDVLQADAILLGTTENFGYMAGLIKDFFERIYYPVRETKQGLPVAMYIRAGLDGTGTQRSIESIVKGLCWKWVQTPLVLQGEWQDEFIEKVEELSSSLAVGLDMNIY